MAPLTRWVEGDGNVLGACCRRTSDDCVSLVTVHVGPTWVSFVGSLPSMERATGHQRAGRQSGASLDTTRPGLFLTDLQPSMERATSEPVDGRVQAWKRLALGHDHRNVCERIGRDQPTRMGEGKFQRDSQFFFVAPLFGRYSSSPVASEGSHGPHGPLLPLHRTTTSQSLVWGRSQAVVGFRGSGRRWWSTSDNGKGRLSQDTSG